LATRGPIPNKNKILRKKIFVGVLILRYDLIRKINTRKIYFSHAFREEPQKKMQALKFLLIPVPLPAIPELGLHSACANLPP
jgi:hypothetical protein